MNTEAQRILLIEDNDDHALLIQTVLKAHVLELVRVASAESAQRYLQGDTMPVALILVDVNLPGMNGIAFLRWAKGAEILAPAVMLSTSDNPQDIRQSFRAGASGYLIKPVGLAELKQKLTHTMDYWFGASQLPLDAPR
ncbi:response regulator [Simiduia sp. 21SJ11W-1]|uniref:response regulator n=1 Tax=Simiduia sp. 21SJ11W-1 TaxID=2909669 RepID=UPI0020A04A5A|nr:response regulator [Simiduia sp. 21SJ11W-1]UTA47515.1 response regulator [Simiduia sp. 21SJ11W-1]